MTQDRGVWPTRCDERIQYLDVLRVLAMLAVVFLHASAATLMVGDGSAVWHFSNALTSLFSAGVPLFFMISGALLLNSHKTVSVGYTLKRRVLRLLVPLLVWSLIYIAYSLVVSWRVGGSPDWAEAIYALKHLPGNPVIVPLWFMYAMIAVYILSPLLKRLVDNLSRDLVLYLLGLWVLFSCLLPTIQAFVPESVSPIFTLHVKYDLDFFAGYLGYFLLGYYLVKMDRTIPKKWLVLAIVVDAVVIALGTWWKTEALGEYSEIFKRQTHLFTMVMSCAVFLLFEDLLRDKRLKPMGDKVVGFLGPLAFGVYLAHSLMIDLLTSWRPIGSIGLLVAYYLAELGASVLLVALLSMVKPLSYAFVGRTYLVWWRGRKETDDARVGGGGKS